jgi:hypothetical protein
MSRIPPRGAPAHPAVSPGLVIDGHADIEAIGPGARYEVHRLRLRRAL